MGNIFLHVWIHLFCLECGTDSSSSSSPPVLMTPIMCSTRKMVVKKKSYLSLRFSPTHFLEDLAVTGSKNLLFE